MRRSWFRRRGPKQWIVYAYPMNPGRYRQAAGPLFEETRAFRPVYIGKTYDHWTNRDHTGKWWWTLRLAGEPQVFATGLTETETLALETRLIRELHPLGNQADNDAATIAHATAVQRRMYSHVINQARPQPAWSWVDVAGTVTAASAIAGLLWWAL